jgi:4-diphosphocytidyl-2-C-methyl-D-erythritol kinase
VTVLEKFAPAKINLALHVTGQRGDGYHLLDTLVGFADIGDRLTFRPAQSLTLSISGPECGTLQPTPDNLILQAAKRLQEFTGRTDCGAAIYLEKNLPVASGIGGGSADAAATLTGLCQLWQLSVPTPDLKKLALSLGSDVPMCLNGKSARVRGIGEHIEETPIDGFAMVLINPRIEVSTQVVFNRLCEKSNPPLPAKSRADSSISYLCNLRNDLQAPAIDVEPSIQKCLTAMNACEGCNLTRMSGSGATCFGLFYTLDQAKFAAGQLKLDHPNWWVVDTSLIH